MRLIAQLAQSGFIDFGETKQYSFVRYKLIYFQITMEEGIVNEAKLFVPEWIRNELEAKSFVYCTLECFNTKGKLHLIIHRLETYIYAVLITFGHISWEKISVDLGIY